MSQALELAYWKRFFIAFCASSVLVFACSLSMQLHVLKEPAQLLAVVAGVVVSSLPGAALSALTFRSNQLALILGAQVITVLALATWFGLKV